MQANRTVVVTGAKRNDGEVERVRLNAAYVAALENAGLVPLVLPPLSRPEDAAEVVEHAGGLVLSGGGDLDPGLYGEPLHPKGNPPDAARDATELALINAARQRKRPVLAICRGIQALNVALGGTLVQDIASQVHGALEHNTTARRAERSHPVSVTPESRLARALGAIEISVNSLHHQAVARVAAGLRATAWSPDGIIEGIETVDDWWVLAVQWHPEEMDKTEEKWDRGLFRAFARAVVDTGKV